MPEEEQRYRINVTVQPYEDLKTALGWIVVISLVLVAAVAYAIYVLWPLIVAAVAVAAAILVVRAMTRAHVNGNGSSLASDGRVNLPAASDERGIVCKQCGYEADPVFGDFAGFETCRRCNAHDFYFRCLNCTKLTIHSVINSCAYSVAVCPVPKGDRQIAPSPLRRKFRRHV